MQLPSLTSHVFQVKIVDTFDVEDVVFSVETFLDLYTSEMDVDVQDYSKKNYSS